MKSSVIFELLRELDANHLHFELSRYRPDCILVTVTIVGLRIEVSVFEDDHIEYSLFEGNEDVLGDVTKLYELFRSDK
jgi:hypothetical protein